MPKNYIGKSKMRGFQIISQSRDGSKTRYNAAITWDSDEIPKAIKKISFDEDRSVVSTMRVLIKEALAARGVKV